MRFFKHGEILAITMPESLRKKFDVKEGDDYEFVEVDAGFFVLLTKEKLNELLKKHVQEKVGLTTLNTSPATQSTKPQNAFLPASASFQAGGFGIKQQLHNNGFLVLENEEQARQASKELEKETKSGDVRGVRNFDKKFYLTTREFFETNSRSIQKTLSKTDLTAAEVSKESKLSLDACLAVLCLLKEEGEVIEKKRGVFSLVK